MPPRIQPIEDQQVSADVRRRFKMAERRGAPNATLLRILARDPDSLDVFYSAWNKIFYGGRVDHPLKEIVRVRMARLRGCGY